MAPFIISVSFMDFMCPLPDECEVTQIPILNVAFRVTVLPVTANVYFRRYCCDLPRGNNRS